MLPLQALRKSGFKAGFSNGFSLVELVVTMAIGLTLVISLSAALITQQRDQVNLKQNLEAVDVESEVRLLLNDPAACTRTIGTGAPVTATAPLPALLNNDGSVAMRPGQVFSNLVRLSSLRLTTIVIPPNGRGRWQMELALDFAPVAGSTNIKRRTVEVYVDTDSTTGLIRGCAVNVTDTPPYDCVVRSGFSTGRTAVVSCVDPEKVVSCGMADDDPDKNDWRRTVPRSPAAPNGCYCYDDDDRRNIRCLAICCRG